MPHRDEWQFDNQELEIAVYNHVNTMCHARGRMKIKSENENQKWKAHKILALFLC